MKTPLTFLLALTFLFLFSGSVYGDDYKDGKDAMRRGDYKTGIGKFKLLAEQGEEKSTQQLAEIAKNQALMVMCLQ
jgi:hypothetical protein